MWAGLEPALAHCPIGCQPSCLPPPGAGEVSSVYTVLWCLLQGRGWVGMEGPHLLCLCSSLTLPPDLGPCCSRPVGLPPSASPILHRPLRGCRRRGPQRIQASGSKGLRLWRVLIP